MDRTALRIAGPGDQPGLLEHLNVFGHRLFRDFERFGQLIDDGRPAGQSRNDGASDRIGKRHEGAVHPCVGISVAPHLSTFCFINELVDYKIEVGMCDVKGSPRDGSDICRESASNALQKSVFAEEPVVSACGG
jgi:hypothetical protein